MIYYNNSHNKILHNQSPTYTYSWNDITLSNIKQFILDRQQFRTNEVCLHEFGIDKSRFDFISINPYSQRIRILEYKVNKNDYINDSKHQNYMNYCNTLTFVTPFDMVDEVKTQCGLLQVFKWTRNSRNGLGGIWIRKPKVKTMDNGIYTHIVGMMLVRLVQGRKPDFF